MSDKKLREKADALIAFTQQGPRFIAWVEAVTDALAPEKVAKVETTADRIAADLKAGTFCGVQPAPPEPAKVECPNCGEMTERSHSRYEGPGPDKWACQPAPPEPAAREMPEAKSFPVGNCPICGELVAPWNKHAKYEGGYNCEISELDDRHMRLASPEAQAKFRAEMDRRAVEIGTDRLVGVASRPAGEMVTVGVWQLEELLKYADLAEVALRTGFHPPEFLFQPADRSLRQAIDAVNAQRAEWRSQAAQTVAVGMTEELEHVLSIAERDLRYKEECFDDSARTVPDERIERLRAAIAAVREQFGKRPKLEKVRGALSWLKMQYEPGSQGYTPNATVWKMTEAALAELDAAEGKGEGRG